MGVLGCVAWKKVGEKVKVFLAPEKHKTRAGRVPFGESRESFGRVSGMLGSVGVSKVGGSGRARRGKWW